MGISEGVILIAVAVVMIFLGRPKGLLAPFLQVYIVGQLYVMSAMVMGVIGVTLLILNRPF
jgi:formate-dependent nitrite reductase membrane component NrfD